MTTLQLSSFVPAKIGVFPPMQTPTPHINARDRLIVALDLESAEHAQAMVDALEGVVDFFKIGLSLQLPLEWKRLFGL